MKVGKKMALQADRQDYRNAYNKHWNAYLNWNNTGSVNSRRLLLTYSVECGLKYALMKKEKVYRVSDAQKEVQEVLGTHDFRKLLKELRIIFLMVFWNVQYNICWIYFNRIYDISPFLLCQTKIAFNIFPCI